MKKHFFMDCHTVRDTVYEAETAYKAESGGSLPVLLQVRIWFHLLRCPGCAGELRNLRFLKEIMKNDFLPASPEFGDILMERLYEETGMEENTGVHACGRMAAVESFLSCTARRDVPAIIAAARRISRAAITSFSMVSERDTRIVSPMPSPSRAMRAAVFLTTPATRGPASVTPI